MAHRCCSSGLWIEDGMIISRLFAILSALNLFCAIYLDTPGNLAQGFNYSIALLLGLAAVINAAEDK